MDRAPLPVIHEVLPSEILATIFEEHAKCEWNAPAIDAQVCRFWRQIVLNTPRAWRYLEIIRYKPIQPSIRELQAWLNRSSAVPLHIRVDIDNVLDRWVSIYDLLRNYHTRIASFRIFSGPHYLFESPEFPRLRLLDITNWYLGRVNTFAIQFCSFPEIQSLRLCCVDSRRPMVPLNNLPSMELLALFQTTCTSLVQHSTSLTTLMLDDLSLGDTISSPLDFPSLTYLSLYDVRGLKPHINAPYLVTYHEGGDTIHESFSTPLLSLVEYGLYGPDPGDSVPTKWHNSFPNVSTVAIRALPLVLVSLLDSLSAHLRFLLALRTIGVGSMTENIQITEDEKKTMQSLIAVQSDACHMDVALYFEKARPFRIPIFFGAVSYRTIKWLVNSDARTGPRSSMVKARHLSVIIRTRFHSVMP
jgi:hypothetical protein